jgi:cytochrome c
MRNKLLAAVILVGTGLQMGCGNDSARAAAALTGGDPNRGPAVIFHYGCGSCHTIKGIANARGLVGPPLTGLRNRTFVAGMLVNTPGNLTHWIEKPKSVNPHTAMPELGVTGRDATDIAAYLYSIN